MRYVLLIIVCAFVSFERAAAATDYDAYVTGQRLLRIGLATGYDRVRVFADGPVRLARYPSRSATLPPGVSVQDGKKTGAGRHSVRITGLTSTQGRDDLAASLRLRGYQVQTGAIGSPNALTIIDIPTERRAELIVRRLNRTGPGAAEILQPTAAMQGRSQIVIDTKAARRNLASSGPLDIIPNDGTSLSFRAYGADSRPKELEEECPGTLRVVAGKSGVSVVAIMSLDEYIRGVVCREMPSDFQMEALRAQAIIARTYALTNLGKHGGDGFDLCTTVHCQVYSSRERQSARANAAIDATRGQIMTRGGHLSGAMYHAVCGGHTEDLENVCGVRDLSLRGVPDRQWSGSLFQLGTKPALGNFLNSHGNAYCRRASRFRWKRTFTRKHLSVTFAKTLPRLLGGKAKTVGDLRDVQVTKRSRNGRAQRLVIVGSKARYELKSNDIRWVFGDGTMGSGLYSTLFIIGRHGGSGGVPERFEVSGGGWGHGVGLCQEGANGMALAGYDCETILHHYYTDVVISPPRS